MSYCENIPKVRDVVTMNNGFFSHLDYTFLFDVDALQLDVLFYANYGEKNVAPLIKCYTPVIDPYPLSDNILDDIGELIVMYYKKKWDRLAAVYNIEYDPIHNYLDEWEDEEDGTVDTTFGGTLTTVDTLGTLVSHSSTRTDNLQEREDRHYTNGNDREYRNDKTRTDYSSGESHVIDSADPLVTVTDYGKVDTRVDLLKKENKGEENTVNSGSDTNAVWGFNSAANPVNSDRMTAGTTQRHVLGNPSTGQNYLTEDNTGSQTHTLSGRDTITRTGTNSDNKTGYDEVTHTGHVIDDGSESGYGTIANTGTQSTASSDRATGSNTRVATDARTRGESTDRDRSGRHFGNIGNLTSQKMINEEIELWKWSYVHTILEDVKDFLTLPVYL